LVFGNKNLLSKRLVPIRKETRRDDLGLHFLSSRKSDDCVRIRRLRVGNAKVFGMNDVDF
jgi:hypothetical protein